MKRIILLFLAVFACFGCRSVDVGYLRAENAEYIPDEMVIRKVLDPDQDKIMIEYNSPWVTTIIQGVLGTQPVLYEVHSVKAEDGGDAEVFRKELSIRGHGRMEVPLHFEAPVGKYIVSVKVKNQDYSHVLEDAFTFVVQ